jgi:hypothetical protein
MSTAVSEVDRFKKLNKAIMREDCIFVTDFCKQYMVVFMIKNLTFSTDEVWFHLSAQNSMYWSNIGLGQTYEVPCHDQKFGVYCANASSQIVGPIFFLNSLSIQCGRPVIFFGLCVFVFWFRVSLDVVLLFISHILCKRDELVAAAATTTTTTTTTTVNSKAIPVTGHGGS